MGGRGMGEGAKLEDVSDGQKARQCKKTDFNIELHQCKCHRILKHPIKLENQKNGRREESD